MEEGDEVSYLGQNLLRWVTRGRGPSGRSPEAEGPEVGPLGQNLLRWVTWDKDQHS